MLEKPIQFWNVLSMKRDLEKWNSGGSMSLKGIKGGIPRHHIAYLKAVKIHDATFDLPFH